MLRHNALRAGEKGVFAYAPLLVPAELDDGYVTDGGGREEQFAGTSEG